MEPFLGEIKIVAFPFAPRGWAFCNGQVLPINQNQALFSLLGTDFGGDGITNFALPDFQGRAPMHRGNQQVQGEKGGEQTHALLTTEMPIHNHGLIASPEAATADSPIDNLLAASQTPVYGTTQDLAPMAQDTVSVVGASAPHENMQPFLVMNFVIALQGIFPSRS